MLQLTNEARARGGVCGSETFGPSAPVTWNAKLATSAQGHASDMAAHNYFSHTSQDGRTFDVRISNAGYLWRAISENIAAGQQTPQQVITSWINSPGHCRDMLDPTYTELGVGFDAGGTSTLNHYWVQDFGKPR